MHGEVVVEASGEGAVMVGDGVGSEACVRGDGRGSRVKLGRLVALVVVGGGVSGELLATGRFLFLEGRVDADSSSGGGGGGGGGGDHFLGIGNCFSRASRM